MCFDALRSPEDTALRVLFANRKLERLKEDQGYTGGFSSDVVKAFRRRIDLILSADDERSFPRIGAVSFEKLKGDRRNQWSMRLSGPWRLLLEFVRDETGKIVVIIDIVDYHR